MSADCFKAVDFFFKLFGIWMDNSSRYKMVAYIVWDSFVFFLGCGFAALEAMMIRTSIKDLRLFFKVFGMFAGHQLALMKFVVMVKNYGKLSNLKTKLRSRCFRYDPFDLFDPEKMMSESARFCARFATFMFTAYGMVGVTAHVSALWRLDTEQHGKYFEGNSSCDDFIPYVFVNPFDDGSIRGCKNALLMMDICFYILSTYMAGYDAIFCCLIVCLDTQLQILSIATKNVRERLLTGSGLSEEYRMSHDNVSPDFEKRLYMEIRKCNRHLSFLLRYIFIFDAN
ncbi:unnamed protein product [Acanthoscelides obtectus]|uniref:Uncharacterized protein n=1 Tax=Acanthoscelides obtectus TaxID=200917 RepID=A0A9P0ML69_ACAOB|nr:unnamed protein product [Acanthoscelides obtectus]CAK1631360.1 hypothetical protein AOBTE_LOCUS6906 [Acanthoscelides obtectus]